MKEIWKDIPNYEGYYQVSNLGNVKSLERTIIYSDGHKHRLKTRILKYAKNIQGRKFIVLNKEGNSKQIFIHKLVAITFLNHKPNGLISVVDHINNDYTDNRLENLQIITQRKNTSKDKCRYNLSSKYVGVHFDKKEKKWMSRILIEGKRMYLGLFEIEKEANKYYQDALKCVLENRIEDIKVKTPNFTSKHKGVSFHKSQKKWQASIYTDKKLK